MGTPPLLAERPLGRGSLGSPLQRILVVLGTALAVGAALNLVTGKVTVGLVCAGAAVAAAAGWRVAARGDVERAAAVSFHTLALTLGVIIAVGHGTRDYGMAAFPAVLFLGSMFLASRAYWVLATLVVAMVSTVGVAELQGLLPGRAVPAPELRNLVNLLLIVGVSAVGGRVLMHAVLASLQRERDMGDELRVSQERIQTLFRSTQSAVVVTRLDDGTYLEVNDAYLTMFGFAREEVIGHTSLELGIWEEATDRDRFVRQIRDERVVKSFETRLRKKTGESIETQLSGERYEMGGLECMVISTVDVTAQRQTERRAEFLATRDALTGMPNRTLALDRLQRGLERARRTGGTLALVHLGLDRFRGLNDSVGRAQGDLVLREVAVRLGAILQSDDTLARIGGDEFLLVVESLNHPSEATHLAGRVMSAFDRDFTAEGRHVRVGCSAGLSLFSGERLDAETLLGQADTAMHFAKARGGGRLLRFDQDMVERLGDRLTMESSLRESIADEVLQLVYQPKFDIQTNAITGVEALSRWTHPTLGIVAPQHFISVAEDSELICDLGSWVLRESCAQVARWRQDGRRAIPIAMNVSARQLTARLPALLSTCAEERGVEPGLLELEITETMLISSPEASRLVLEQVAGGGTGVVLDDFGVGFSSLTHVKLMHLSGIKVDRSFVIDIATSRHDRAIVTAIVGLAHGLGLRVIAEGIESEAQLRILRDLGCDEAQGFFLSRPLTGDEVAAQFMARLD